MADMASTILTIYDMISKSCKKLSKLERNVFKISKHLENSHCHKCDGNSDKPVTAGFISCTTHPGLQTVPLSTGSGPVHCEPCPKFDRDEVKSILTSSVRGMTEERGSLAVEVELEARQEVYQDLLKFHTADQVLPG